MEEIVQQINKIFTDTETVARKLDNDFEVFKVKLDNIVYGTKELSLTPQQKKKIKRLSVIVDDDESDNERIELITKKTKQIVIKTEKIETSISSSRPSRAAKLKVGCFKEPTLGTKLRRPSEGDDTLSATHVALEKSTRNAKEDSQNSSRDPNHSQKSTEENEKRESNPTKRSIEEDPTQDNNNKENSVEATKKVDESLLIVPEGDALVVVLSDNETDKLMPPPAEIPKKKTTRKGKQSETRSEPSTRSSRLRIKQEKLSIDKGIEKENSVESSEAASDKLINDIVGEIKHEKLEDDTATKKSKSKRGRKPFKCLPIKEELVNGENENVEQQQSKTTRQSASIENKEKVKQPSMESVYEDAVSDNASKTTSKKARNVVTENESEDILSPKEPQADATFISAKDVPLPETDATFVASTCPQKTFVMDKSKEMDTNTMPHEPNNFRSHDITTNKVASPIDTTFSINNETFKAQPSQQKTMEQVMRSSIMTEDDSSEEIMPPPISKPVVLSKANQKKELFNSPCIQSPVKKKVEAFEKHANAMASPAPTRQTRTKTKLKENKDPEHHVEKQITPLLKRDIAKLLTPTQSNITPNIGIQNTKYLANSTSKIAQIQKSSKVTPSTGTISKTQSLSRENSVEDVKKAVYASKLQQIVDEKKKKREQKQQQAASAREAREKERTEKLKKALLEREEKMRRKAQELEMKKQLEEINKNIKHQEEKRDVQRKMDKKQLEQELADAARKEREMLDNMKIQKAKEELQQKLLENQRLLQQKKLAKKVKDALIYDFELLNSSDSTDEEGKTSSKRPPPPFWSKPAMRNLLIERQSQVPTKIVDAFFSVQPMTPDLREIFPAIDARYLKRNSSMYWNTPPRYSQLPKY